MTVVRSAQQVAAWLSPDRLDADLLAGAGRAGISSHVRPSSSRPAFFLFVPPHCLKKNGTSACAHCSRRSVTQARSIGRDRGPDSPPTIAQSIPSRFSSGNGPSRGSSERNFTSAPVSRRSSMRDRYLSVSTLTPIQMLGAHSSFEFSRASRSARFVSTWKRCQYAWRITSKTLCM